MRFYAPGGLGSLPSCLPHSPPWELWDFLLWFLSDFHRLISLHGDPSCGGDDDFLWRFFSTDGRTLVCVLDCSSAFVNAECFGCCGFDCCMHWVWFSGVLPQFGISIFAMVADTFGGRCLGGEATCFSQFGSGGLPPAGSSLMTWICFVHEHFVYCFFFVSWFLPTFLSFGYLIWYFKTVNALA